MFVQLNGVCGRPAYFNPEAVACFYSATFLDQTPCTLILMKCGKKLYVLDERDEVARKFGVE